jgi:hypothetical protein
MFSMNLLSMLFHRELQIQSSKFSNTANILNSLFHVSLPESHADVPRKFIEQIIMISYNGLERRSTAIIYISADGSFVTVRIALFKALIGEELIINRYSA